MLIKKIIFSATLAASFLAAMPAQAFFCSGKSNRPPPLVSPVFAYYPQQQFFMPYGYPAYYAPRYQYFTFPPKASVGQ